MNQLESDLDAEKGAIAAYNAAVRQSVEAGDNGTRALLESILHDEEEHIDWLEAQLDQIRQVGAQNYLAQHIS